MRKRTIDEKILAEINRLESYNGTYRSKCRRNLRLYEYSPTLSLDNLSDDAVVGYYQQGFFDVEDDTTSSIQENVIRSCIDTLVSKIASQKVRPYINTVNGSFREMQVAKAAQDYFDAVYDDQNVNNIITRAFKDACIFDRGVVFVDKDLKKVERVMPWQIYINPREWSYNRLTQLLWKQEQYPTSLLPIKVDSDQEYVTYYLYWDLNAAKKYYYIPELNHYEEEKWEADALPFIFIQYSDSIKGSTAQSIVDLLYGIQMEIDLIMNKIKDASQSVPTQRYFVPEQSTIKIDKLSDRSGEFVTYTALPGQSGVPILNSTEPFMDPQWLQTLEALKQHAYEAVGISQLSATSQKPQGLNSGIALSTMEDIESDRFETQLNVVIRSYVDLAKLMIQIYDQTQDILPANRLRSTISWSDIVEMRDQMTIQFSAAQSLSKDPSTKLQQLQALYAAGLIPQSRIAQLMDLPDLQLGYSLANNSINAVLAVIDDCLENDNFDIPDYIPNQMLLEEIMNTCLSLKAANKAENEEDINKLLQLYDLAQQKNIEAQTSSEFAALNTLGQELQQDMADPYGQINTAVNKQMDIANQQIQQATQQGDINETNA